MEIRYKKKYVNRKLPKIIFKPTALVTYGAMKCVEVETDDGIYAEIPIERFNSDFVLKKEYSKEPIKRKENILEWADKKQLLKPENAITQLAKLTEEVGELANAILKKNKSGQKDALGDIRVVINILANQLGFDIDDCEETAWNVIKNRKGKTINGTFIKEEDL
jgi:NTP pyrophosphatase (non-canonical NTP hydrolase)